MQTPVQPKRKLTFGSFKPDEKVDDHGILRRSDFAGVAPDDAARRILVFVSGRKQLAPKTVHKNENMVRRVLVELAEQGLDLASVTRSHLNQYHQLIRARTQLPEDDEEHWTKNYANAIVITWNSMMRQAFGAGDHGAEDVRCSPEKPCAAEEVALLGGFETSRRDIDVMDEAELDRMREAIRAASVGNVYGDFESEHSKRTFVAFFETIASLGCRYASAASIRVKDVHLDVGAPFIAFPHVKNLKKLLKKWKTMRDIPWPILTPLAARTLRDHIEYLRTTPFWRGDETRVFAVPDAKAGVLTNQGANAALARMGVRIGTEKATNCHAVRSAVGTIIGRRCRDPTVGAMQLLIDEKTFMQHYWRPPSSHQRIILDSLPRSKYDAPEGLAAALSSPSETIPALAVSESPPSLSGTDVPLAA